MSRIYTGADQLIGHTPLLELTHIEKKEGLNARILAKLEYFNPAGSVKDRIAKGMIDDAEAAGALKPGSVIIEPTSRQHRHRSGFRRGGARLPHHHRHAGDDERRAPPTDEGVWRGAGAQRRREGHEGRDCQGERAGGGNSEQLHPRSVCEPGEPGGAQGERPARKSGRIPTARWISSWRASARAARSPAWANTSRRRTRTCGWLRWNRRPPRC